MPSIEQYDWSKLQPKLRSSQTTHGTKNFKEVKIIEQRKNSKHGDLKVTRHYKEPYQCSKCKFIGAVRKDLDDHWLLDH